MKKDNSENNKAKDRDIREEYDFSKLKGGERGKYFKDYRAGHSVKIRKKEGNLVVKNYKLEEGAVMLDPDVRPFFPDSESVNKTLRKLIELIPKKQSK